MVALNRIQIHAIKGKPATKKYFATIMNEQCSVVSHHICKDSNYPMHKILLLLKPYYKKETLAVFLALLFHGCGAIGILFTPYKDWFVANTPLNLMLMAFLLWWVQPRKNIGFYVFFAICFCVGMGVEMIGVNTGKLFGNYHYGSVMGRKLNGVPYLIGIYWFVTIFGIGTLLSQLQAWVEERYALLDMSLSPIVSWFSFILDGALMATTLDFFIEPVAIHLKYWSWANDQVPNFNYECWFMVSAILMAVFKKMEFSKDNQFAIHLLIIQFLFFFALNTSLP